MIKPFFNNDGATIYNGDCLDVLRQLPDGSVQTCITSPPYWGLRDYCVHGQLGLERCPDCLGWAGGRPCGDCYVCHLVAVFREVRRVLRRDGTLWLNLGHTYAGYWGKKYAHKPFGKDRTPDASTPPNKPSLDFAHSAIKPKDLVGIPWRVALALQADGWYLRSDVIWAKPNPSPEAVRDRPTRSHEYLFLLSPSRRYYFDRAAIAEPRAKDADSRREGGTKKVCMAEKPEHPDDPRYEADSHAHGRRRPAVDVPAGRNKRSVWTIPTRRYSGAHFAVFPAELVVPCILAGTGAAGCCAKCGAAYCRSLPTAVEPQSETWMPSCRCVSSPPVPCVVLDPFLGSGTTTAVARQLGRQSIGIELSAAYCRLAAERLNQRSLMANACA